MPSRLGHGPYVLTIREVDPRAVEDRVRRALLHGAPAEAPVTGVLDRLGRAVDHARTLPVPRAAVAWWNASTLPAWLDGVELPGIGVVARDVRRLSAYVVTLGDAWDAAIARYCEQDEAAAGWFLDQVASGWVDEAARCLERMLEEQVVPMSLARTRRVRPGYRGHPSLDWQARLCDATGAGAIGVRTLPSGVLIPAKTVTGLLGWIVNGASTA
jgi:hypothetical protein